MTNDNNGEDWDSLPLSEPAEDDVTRGVTTKSTVTKLVLWAERFELFGLRPVHCWVSAEIFAELCSEVTSIRAPGALEPPARPTWLHLNVIGATISIAPCDRLHGADALAWQFLGRP